MDTKLIQKTARKFGGILTKNSPTLLTGLSVAGLITTVAMAVKATPKAIQILDEASYNDLTFKHREIPTKEEIALIWKCYVPTMAMGIVTIACIISANSINLRRNAALMSVYSLSEAALKEYQVKVVETIGQNKAKQIKDEIIKDKITKNPVDDNEVINTGKGETLCYEALSGRYFKSDIECIRKAINNLNRSMMSEMLITLNEVYYALDLRATKLGEIIGWNVDDGLLDPYFSSQLTEDGTPCLVIDFSEEPRYLYID